MRAKLLAAASIGALLAGPAFAQTGGTTGAAAGAMTEEDMEQLGEALEQAGFSDFRPVTGAHVFRGMSADGNSAVIAVAPEMGNNAGGAGTTGDATGTGMADAGMFQVTTEDGRTLFIVVRPEMTGMTGGGTTTGDATGGTGATGTQTAETATGGDTADDADTTTANADDAASGATGGDADTTTAESDAGGTTGADAAGTTTADNNTGDTNDGDTTADGALKMNIDLSGRQQVPPVETSGTGQIAVTFDSESRELSWELDYSGLSSDATAAHFHGPADPGETAGPVVALDDFSDGAEGSATLTEAQAEQLMAGKWYFNLHTENNPNGEIRGQVTAVQ